MAALGVVKDKPPNKIQPPLEDGIHLRFAFAPERGFPWHGYYLFRRLQEPSTPRCLQAKFNRDWKPGPWPGVQANFPGGVFSSDANLVFLDQFSPLGSPEFDLRHRKYLRFELPAKERAREFHVKLGMLGDAPPPTQRCVIFTEIEPGLYPNPILSANVEFTALTGDGINKNCEIRLSKDTAGLVCLDQVIVGLPAIASSIEVELFQTASTAEVMTIDGNGSLLAQKSAPAFEGRQTIQLSGGAIAFVRIVALKGTLVLRFCYTTDRRDPTNTTATTATTATAASTATTEAQAPPLLGPIKLRGFDGPVRVAETTISGPAGGIVTAVLAADTMTALEIEGGPAALIDICTVAISDDLARGWTPLVKQPICLPVELKDYPCPGKPATLAKARSLAQSRIHYGTASTWVGKTFTELNTLLNDLVVGGPAGGAMVNRTKSYPASAPDAPAMPDLHPLDVVLVASLHPANAMMLGLYWIDSTAQVGTAYDYMVMADHGGRFHGEPKAALVALAAGLPVDVDVWVTFGKKREAAPPLAPPAAPTVYALPGATTGTNAPVSNVPILVPPGGRNMAGLDWQIEAAPDGSLLPGGPVGYHLWRAILKSGPPSSPPPSPAYQLLTADRLIVATETPLPSGEAPERASDWPPFPLKAFDPGLPDGWYSYCLSAVDLFGRHSAMGPPGPWLQWAWPTPPPPALPAPKPWYYVDPPAQRQINPFAVRLIDKTPPPRVQGVEADALDPDDRMLLRDVAYSKWWAARETVAWWKKLGVDRDRVLPLRVRWKWTAAQMLQAPDTKEFRIYFHPGKNPPAPDHTDPAKWQDRIYVIDYANPKTFTVITDADGVKLRQYEVLLPLLPVPKGPKFPGIPMAPSESEEIVYAQISVSAADDKPYTDDDPNRASGAWGKRFGNEGLLGAPAKIYRVLRSKPPAPAAVDVSEKVWATRADYHSRSYYTFRWAKSGALKAHIFRTLDDTLFQVDWEQRHQGAPPVSPKEPANFPIPTWTQATRIAIAAEINGLVVPGSTALFDDAVRAAYAALSNNALRTLAGLPRNEAAFSQITYLPLDPADAGNADRVGPDGTEAYIPNTNLCAYTAELDGRARNRYFFRAAYVNAAQTVGPLGPSSPPVYLPKVEPPRTPAIVKVVGGDRRATITWAIANADASGQYILYRTDDEHRLRDVRLMNQVVTIAAGDLDASAAKAEWLDANDLRGGKTYFYCLVLVDADGNASAPSKPISVNVADLSVPSPPFWTEQTWLLERQSDHALLDWPDDGVVPADHTPVLRLSWVTDVEQPIFVLTRRERYANLWSAPAGSDQIAASQLNAGEYSWIDHDAAPDKLWEYRIKLQTLNGVWSTQYQVLPVTPPVMADVR